MSNVVTAVFGGSKVVRTRALYQWDYGQVLQFDGIELPWGKVNGAFIVSENMADNGGVAVTLDIMSRTEGASYEEYFSNWARVWCMKAKPEYQALLLSLDVHGPAILRANMQPRNFKEWYDTFDVKSILKALVRISVHTADRGDRIAWVGSTLVSKIEMRGSAD